MLCRVAEEKAAEMRAKVKQEGEAHIAEVKQTTEAMLAAELKTMRERAAALEVKKKKEALAEAAALEQAARERLDEAASMIVWEIIEKCQ